MKIGIAITTHNRNKGCDFVKQQITKFLPPDAKCVIVDDASRIPYKGATYRFSSNVGAVIAKNKCLELLQDCDHIFLFDDDTYPVKPNWWKPYVESKENHLSYTFKYPHKLEGGHRISENPNGCMMYISKKCLDTIGGFDTDFDTYGYWHANYSLRAFNNGLTSFPFMDVEQRLFKCMDEDNSISTSRPDRGRFIAGNKKLYEDKKESKEYIDFVRQKEPKIYYSTPYATDFNIGRAYNEFVALLPDDAWVCLRDGDTCFTTPDSNWGKQIADIVKKHGNDFQLIGCYTNRLASPNQLYNKAFSEDWDWMEHKQIGKQLYNNHYDEVVKVQHGIAGMFLLFPKSTWLKCRFKEDLPYRIFDTDFCNKIKKLGGKIGMAKGIYLFHDYRAGKENPKQNVSHLK